MRRNVRGNLSACLFCLVFSFFGNECSCFVYLAHDMFAHELNHGDSRETLCSAVSYIGPPGSLELTKERI